MSKLYWTYNKGNDFQNIAFAPISNSYSIYADCYYYEKYNGKAFKSREEAADFLLAEGYKPYC